MDEELKTVAVLALQTSVVIATQEQWKRVSELLSMRLQHPVALITLRDEPSSEETIQSVVEWYHAQGFHRFVVMPVGLELFDLDELHSLLFWTRSLPHKIRVHVARSWTVKDWADAISPAIVDALAQFPCPGAQSQPSDKKGILFLANEGDAATSSGLEIGTEVAALAYHVQQQVDGLEIGYAFVRHQKPSLPQAVLRLDSNRINDIVILHWRMDQTDVEDSISKLGSLHETELTIVRLGYACRWNRVSTMQPTPLQLLEHPGWLHVAVGIYLEALSTRSIERYFESKPEGSESKAPSLRLELLSLERKMDAMLPSEYQGRTDEVNSQSMGTASLPSDEFGLVPWDKIWTSFCDLAMAGGPPHRGKLLEAVTVQEAMDNLPAYETVVQEIRRGIELVTGLPTVRAEALGWVGVQCESEAMAIWLMRAIIVENVIVRREGHLLLLPAGPAFGVKKEIKNVITSVAKTVHYWRSHLRLQ